MTKLNFKQIPYKSLDGEEKTIDMCEQIGNALYFNVADVSQLDIAKDIYHGKDVELDVELRELIEKLIVPNIQVAFIKLALIEFLKDQ